MSEAKRFNEGKPRLDRTLLFELKYLAEHMMQGEIKYPDDGDMPNWLKGGKPDKEYLGSITRHAAAIARGEIYCPELGTTHAAAIAWNALALCTCNYDKRDLPPLNPDFDQEAFIAQYSDGGSKPEPKYAVGDTLWFGERNLGPVTEIEWSKSSGAYVYYFDNPPDNGYVVMGEDALSATDPKQTPRLFQDGERVTVYEYGDEFTGTPLYFGTILRAEWWDFSDDEFYNSQGLYPYFWEYTMQIEDSGAIRFIPEHRLWRRL